MTDFVVKYPIVVDRDKMQISVGNYVSSHPYLYHLRENDSSIKYQVLEANGEHEPNNLSLKERNKYYCDLLGPKFNRRFRAANYNLWMNDMVPSTRDMFRKRSGLQWADYDNDIVRLAHNVLPLINEAERDGLHNLIPAIIAFQDSPHNIRKKIGKGMWKRIAHNSKTRNTLILHAASRTKDVDATFLDFMDVPSGILPAIGRQGHLTIRTQVLAAKLAKRKTTREFYQAANLVYDTIRMGIVIDPKWDLDKVREEHDRVVREAREAVLAQHPNPFRRTPRKLDNVSTEPFIEPWDFHSIEGFNAILLTTQYDIVQEGNDQNHCVGTYAQESRNGDYAVFKIDGKERATLGLRKSPIKYIDSVVLKEYEKWRYEKWRVDQCYGASNVAVSEECRNFAHMVAQAFTEEMKLRNILSKKIGAEAPQSGVVVAL